MTARFPPSLLLVPALLAFAMYVPVLQTGFLGDDFGLLHAFDGCDGAKGTLRCVGHMFVSGVGPPSNQYRPLTMASFAANAMYGPDPSGWHLVNIALQMANAALVTLLAWQVVGEGTARARAAAVVAGCLFAWFAPSVEATAWIAARFDGMALLWLLVAANAFMASRAWLDGFAWLSLAATVSSYMSKESATIGGPLILALAWYRYGAVRALPRALPWLLVAIVLGAISLDLFAVLLGGEWLANCAGMIPWARTALPDATPLTVFAAAGIVLAVCAVAAGVAERKKGRALLALAFSIAAAFALLLPHWTWASTGEGGRVLLVIGALACVAAALPLAAARQPRTLAWIAAFVLLGAQYVLADTVVDRWVDAGDDSTVLARALAQAAASTPADGYAFVVIPDHVGAIPFGRNAQGGLILPPVQERPLSAKLVVQTEQELARWPDLFERDIIGRLRREPATSVAANPLTPKVPPPHVLPDRYFCWNPDAQALEPITLALTADLANWDDEWRSALAAAGCSG